MRVKRGARAVEADGIKAINRALESGPPRDEYGEFERALRAGREAAAALGHRLGRWRRRVYAPNTAATVACQRCGAVAVVNLENASEASGPAVTRRCTAG